MISFLKYETCIIMLRYEFFFGNEILVFDTGTISHQE